MANEKELVKALEPILRMVADVKREIAALKAIEIPEGKPGADADNEKIAEILIQKHADKVRGERGDPGKDAEPVSYEKLAADLIENPEFLALTKGDKGDSISVEETAKALVDLHLDAIRGPAGKDAEPVSQEQLIANLIADKQFISLAKGEKGEPADPQEVAKLLVRDHLDLIRGPAGKDADNVEIVLDDVVDALLKSSDFVSMSKGEKGDTPPVDEIITALFTKHGEELRGKDGQDANPDEIARSIKADLAFVESLKGQPGEKGDPGEPGEVGQPGAGIEAPHWKKGIHREGVTVTHFAGRFYRAVRDTADEPGQSDDWERVGTSGLRFRGEKQADTKYEGGDVFTSAGSAYVWQDGKAHLLAQAGKKGDPGKDGDPGAPGKDAPTFVAGELADDRLLLAMSDGEIMECELKDFGARQHALSVETYSALTEQKRKSLEARGTPLDVFCGVWQESKQYQGGDVVSHANALWSCKSAGAKGRFNPDSWNRVIAFPAGKQKVKTVSAKNITRIPGRKAAGENLNACVEAIAENELTEFEIQTWHETDSFMPVIRLATFDPSMLLPAKAVNIEAIHIHNFSSGHIGTDTDRKASLDDVGFALSADLVGTTKLVSTVRIDRRNPDFDMIEIESRYRNIENEMMSYTVTAWTEKEYPVCFIGFGPAQDDGSHWRAFYK